MATADFDRNQFNRRVDKLIARVEAGNPISREFTAEFINTIELCRRVAEFDPWLASELLISGIMLTYKTGVAVIRGL